MIPLHSIKGEGFPFTDTEILLIKMWHIRNFRMPLYLSKKTRMFRWGELKYEWDNTNIWLTGRNGDNGMPFEDIRKRAAKLEFDPSWVTLI